MTDLTYEVYVGLWLNVERIRRTKALATARGIGYAFHRDAFLDVDWVDAWCPLLEQVAEAHYRAQVEQSNANLWREGE